MWSSCFPIQAQPAKQGHIFFLVKWDSTKRKNKSTTEADLKDGITTHKEFMRILPESGCVSYGSGT